MTILETFAEHNQPLCMIEFNKVCSDQWRDSVINALSGLGRVATLHSYDVWTVEPL